MNIVQEFRLEVEVPPGGDPSWPRIKVTIDGKDFSGEGNIGFEAQKLLKEKSPLLPTKEARRIAVYMCSCGEPGCGSLAPLISADDDFVYWTDTRDFVGVFNDPEANNPDASWGKRTEIPDFKFSRSQYEEAVIAAIEDQSWKTSDRATSELVEERLADHHDYFAQYGLTFEWASPERANETFVSFGMAGRDPKRPQISQRMAMVKSSGDPSARADQVVQYLLSTPPSDWTAPQY